IFALGCSQRYSMRSSTQPAIDRRSALPRHYGNDTCRLLFPGRDPRLEHDHLTASRVAKAERCGPLCDPKLMHFSAEASKQMASSGKPRQRAPMGCLGPDHPMGGFRNSLMFAETIGLVKLGHPRPDSNLSDDAKRGSPETMST